MKAPAPEPLLVLAAGCRIEFGPALHPAATREGRRVELGDHGLALLDCFREATTAGEALSAVKPRFHSSQDWIECRRLVSRLESEGMLVESGKTDDAPAIPAGFASPAIHIAMLDDARRTDAFIRGIQAAVRPEDVVLEIGTGSGILAATAAKAGARKVYAVEQTAIATTAETLFADNGVADRVSLIRGNSSAIGLPEPADIVIGELFGHDPLEENVLESFLDAGRRHLKPGARFLPRAMSILAAPVRLAPELRARRRISVESLAKWQAAYDLDFSALTAWQAQAPDRFIANRADLKQIQRCSAPVRFPSIDFARLDSSIVEFKAEAEIDSPGEIDGVMLWFELDLAEGVSLDADPTSSGADHHWKTPVHLLPAPLPAARGITLEIRYEYGRNAASTASVSRISPKT